MTSTINFCVDVISCYRDRKISLDIFLYFLLFPTDPYIIFMVLEPSSNEFCDLQITINISYMKNQSQNPSSCVINQNPSFIMFSYSLNVKLDAVICGHGMLDYIKEPLSIPRKFLEEGVLNPEYCVWNQKDQQLLRWILSLASTEFLSHVVGCETSV